jgi:enoyl-CoA hydratase/carnithine racemase
VALACDLRVAARDARFGLPEVQLGLIPGTGATARLARVVGHGRAKDLILSGRVIGAEEALAIGLVDELVERADLRDRARELAARFAASSPDAVRAAKHLVDRGLDALLDAESEAFAGLLGGQDAAVGLASFIEHGRAGLAEFRPARAEV